MAEGVGRFYVIELASVPNLQFFIIINFETGSAQPFGGSGIH